MLLELLPHFTRLLPVADKYFAGRSASDKAQQAALAALAAEVTGGLGKAVEANAGLREQLQEQTAQISQVSVEATRARMAIESVESRVGGLERTTGLLVKLLVTALVLLVGEAAVTVVLLLKLKGH